MSKHKLPDPKTMSFGDKLYLVMCHSNTDATSVLFKTDEDGTVWYREIKQPCKYEYLIHEYTYVGVTRSEQIGDTDPQHEFYPALYHFKRAGTGVFEVFLDPEYEYERGQWFTTLDLAQEEVNKRISEFIRANGYHPTTLEPSNG